MEGHTDGRSDRMWIHKVFFQFALSSLHRMCAACPRERAVVFRSPGTLRLISQYVLKLRPLITPSLHHCGQTLPPLRARRQKTHGNQVGNVSKCEQIMTSGASVCTKLFFCSPQCNQFFPACPAAGAGVPQTLHPPAMRHMPEQHQSPPGPLCFSLVFYLFLLNTVVPQDF